MLLGNLRQRFGGAVFAVIAAVFIFICGAILAFVVSPQQALEWRRIERLPQMDAASVAAAPAGQEIVITGTLQGNEALTEDGMVAYTTEQWSVSPPDLTDESETNDEPQGDWSTIERNAPALTLAVSGGEIHTLAVESANFGGSLHETVTPGEGLEAEDTDGTVLADGALRTRGFWDGDLLTVLGEKSSTGDLIPSRLFGGDRVQLVDTIRSGARAAFTGGIAMMICAPIVAVGGAVASLLGRRRRGLL